MSSIIVLIIASHNDIYDSFIALWREKIQLNTLLHSTSIKYRFFFVFSDPSCIEDVVCENDCIFCKCEESLEPGIFFKTMKAISFCEQQFQYDFILRTNLSSFWNFSVLSEELLSNSISIGTIFLQYLDKNQLFINRRWKNFFEIIDSVFGFSWENFFYFLDGAGFLLSREMIRVLLLPIPEDKYSKIILLPDDVAITTLLYYNWMLCKSNYQIKIYELLIGKKYICDVGITHFEPDSKSRIGFVRNKQISGDRYTDILNYKHEIDVFYKT